MTRLEDLLHEAAPSGEVPDPGEARRRGDERNRRRASRAGAVAVFAVACGVFGIGVLSLRDGEDTATKFTDVGASLDGSTEEPSQYSTSSTVMPSPTVAPSAASAESGAPGAMRDASGAAEPVPYVPSDDNTFQPTGVNQFVSPVEEPTSTFGLDVDTGSYSIGRAFVSNGQRPPADSVRVEEYVNSFDYGYEAPSAGLGVTADTAWRDDDLALVRVAVQAARVEMADVPPLHLTFVVDTSGSMDRDNRIGLVKTSLEILAAELRPQDTVAIVTFSTDAGVLLPPTSAADRDAFLDAVRRLAPTGSTNLEGGLRTGYRLADETFDAEGINRVLLLSDGVANVGETGPGSLVALIRDDADRGIKLATVGYGLGNYNDALMEYVADQGDGFYAYVDTEDEADQLFRRDLAGTMVTVAADAKAQVTFDPDVVDAYRLIGYENRALEHDDFSDPTVDAGEVGAGRSTTALYEVRLHGGSDGRIGTAAVRWRDPSIPRSRATAAPVEEETATIAVPRWSVDAATTGFRLAAVVSDVAELLRGSGFVSARGVTMADLADEADRVAGRLGTVDAREFADFVRALVGLSGPCAGVEC